MESGGFQVVYPSDMDSLAREYLYAFRKYSGANEQQLKIKYHSIPIVLHPCISQSNASVAWVPHRVDVFTTPEFKSGYAEGWVPQLAKHEGRHIAQMTHYTTGVFKYMGWILGEQAVALGIGLYPTSWMFEGDAVHAETDFSQAGRGRDPNFLMYFRASFIDGDYRAYDRWRYGSYRWYTPSKYAFGYMMQTAMRRNSATNDIMGDIQHDFASYWYNPFNWNKTFLYRTGMTARKNYRSAVTTFDNAWRSDYLSRMPYSGFERISSEPEGYEAFGWKGGYYTEYHSMVPFEDGSVVSVRTGLSQNAHLVKIMPDGSEKSLRYFATPSLTSSLVKRDSDHIVWSEIVADSRWELRDRSIIREYELSTGKLRNLTSRGHYFNPSFACDGKLMLATEYPSSGSSFLVVLDAGSQEVLCRLEAPCKGQIRRSVAIGGRVYSDIVTGEGEWGIWSVGLDGEGGWQRVLEPQSRSILNLQACGDKLVFESDLDGVTNIYAFDPLCGSLQKLTNARFGAFSPSLEEDGSLYYTDFDKDGYHPVRAAADSLLWQPASMDYPFESDLIESMAEQSLRETEAVSAGQDSTIRAEVDGLESSRYGKIGNIMRIHSWAPFYVSINRIMDASYDHIYQLAAPGVTLISQNTLGTAVTTMGYSYHGGRHAGHVNFNYSGLYPVIELNLDYNDRESAEYSYNAAGKLVGEAPLGNNSVDFSASAYVPVRMSQGGWNSALIPQISYEFSSDIYSLGGVGRGYGQSVVTSVRWYRMLPKLKTALTPRLGFGVEAKLAACAGPYAKDGGAASLYMYGYVPGFTPLQGLRMAFTGQKLLYSTWGSCPSLVSMPRGYSKTLLGDYAKLSLDYSIPIALNDVEPSPLLYLMRVNMVPFVDIAWNRPGGGNAYNMYSYGTTLSVKGHYFRIGAEIEIGTRLSRYWDPVTMNWRCKWDIVTSTSL